MNEPDVLRVRHPSLFIRLLCVSMGVIGLSLLVANVLEIVEGHWSAAIFGGLGIVGALVILRPTLPMLLVGWETVIDRRSRTVTRRVRLAWKVREDRHSFDAFKAVVLHRTWTLGKANRSAGLLAVSLIGPGLRLDLDDPGALPFAKWTREIGRLSSLIDPKRCIGLAASVAERTGLRLRDISGQERPVNPPRARPAFGAWSLDLVDPVLEIERVPRGVRVMLWVLLVTTVLFGLLMVSSNNLGEGLKGVTAVLKLLPLGLLPLAAGFGLSYRSRVTIDFPNRLVRRQGRFAGSRWDESFALDRFAEVIVREIKVPFSKSPVRTVELFEGRFTIALFDVKTLPRSLELAAVRSLGAEGDGLDKNGRLVASAETLARLCGLPIRIVEGVDVGPSPVEAVSTAGD
jgi:hypothetical protein